MAYLLNSHEIRVSRKKEIDQPRLFNNNKPSQAVIMYVPPVSIFKSSALCNRVYVWVSYNSENKQVIISLTALTDWSYALLHFHASTMCHVSTGCMQALGSMLSMAC
jgi:hypothetical protein